MVAAFAALSALSSHKFRGRVYEQISFAQISGAAFSALSAVSAFSQPSSGVKGVAARVFASLAALSAVSALSFHRLKTPYRQAFMHGGENAAASAVAGVSPPCGSAVVFCVRAVFAVRAPPA